MGMLVRYNEEVNTLLKGEDIVRFIKSQRIRWLGHVERMEDNAMPKRMLKGRLYSKRRKRRPRMRWLDNVESDLKKMEVKGWKEKMRDREQWRLVVEEAKAHCRVAGSNIHSRNTCFQLVYSIFLCFFSKNQYITRSSGKTNSPISFDTTRTARKK
jgi:hypothetical protein